MRKVILAVATSLDGYIARPDGGIDFLFTPKDYPMMDFFNRVDTCIMGHKSFLKGLELGGGKIGTFGKIGYVMSRSEKPGERHGLIFVNQSPKRLVEEIRSRKGKDIWLMGGGELTRSFLQDDLVDELSIGVIPTLLGSGIPLFPAGFPERRFRLIENKSYSRGMIALEYRRSPRK